MNHQVSLAAVLLACATGDGRLSPSVQREIVERVECWTWEGANGLVQLPTNIQEVASRVLRGAELTMLFGMANPIECEYVAFIPAGAALDEDWTSKVKASLERHEHPVAVSPLLLRFRGIRTTNRFETGSNPLDWRPWNGPVIKQGGLPAVPHAVEVSIVEMAGLVLRREAIGRVELVPLTSQAWPLLLVRGDNQRHSVAVLDPDIRLAIDEACAESIQPPDGARPYAHAVTVALLTARNVGLRSIRVIAWLLIGVRASPGLLAGPFAAFDNRRRLRWQNSVWGRVDGLARWLRR